ncbi:phosphoribosylformylglycinamidine cyclo-ligase [Candidatus Kinetoplastidibacterium crithidiae]|uniref:Phosphoribosylformylglycinamidine cyclo-ligase n=1 Tax=Candidatus Kinetoplastidibacterium crithidiae TCC036E TaxID=1208918 RepID=M1LXA9_9PROT|nr:phosphoribosylformylglycinamidine cyclo-ligase [Candidatus Kinetoplastibacterium crithidii]AFZ82500.1 phosphoribosylaminoimidazole synthetase [Candidatus Kinetoplastibacterium crithidii (ex Angomonas deanei ATCC 30255)]AGF47839.1 phosphoribosylformylglycinamidine cyclo-ligase [Candidatus Kinetoplastibacterium crithidii TCC036E]
MSNLNSTSLNYRDAGVDIDAGEALINKIKPFAAKTIRSEVLTGIGGFGALFEVPKKFADPVLVSGTDGVGTKLRLAFEWNSHGTVGIDLVAMSVNDILVQGAEPLFFLDYFACGKLSVDIASAVIAGIAKGCELSGCALIGGETAEMPGMYPDGEYDLAGFAVGAVEKSSIINGSSIDVGDIVLGLTSSGAHSNGYSLIRKIIDITGSKPYQDFYGRPLVDVVMAPTKIYVKSILSVINKFGKGIKGLAHITGGGLLDNIPRILNQNISAKLYKDSWRMPDLFNWLQKSGNISDTEMYRVFNCGIGMVLIVPKHQADLIMGELSSNGEDVIKIGEIVNRERNMPSTYVV